MTITTTSSPRVSPLRDGAKVGVAVGAEDMSVPPTPMEPISTETVVSIILRVPRTQIDVNASWIEKEATNQIRYAKISLDGDYLVRPHEIERQIRMDGDADSCWVAVLKPKKRRSSAPLAHTTGTSTPCTLSLWGTC